MFGKVPPGSITDFATSDENLLRLAGFREKNIMILSSKIFLVSKIFFKRTMSEK